MKAASWILALVAAGTGIALLTLLRQTTRADSPSGPPSRPSDSIARPRASDHIAASGSGEPRELPQRTANESTAAGGPSSGEGRLAHEDRPEDVHRSQVEHYRRALESYSELSIGDLRVAQEEAQRAAHTRMKEIRDDLIARGQGLVLPFDAEVPEYMIPAPKTERPIQYATVCTVDPTTGESIETHVFIDPADYPDLVLLQNVRGAITVALKRKQAPEAAD